MKPSDFDKFWREHFVSYTEDIPARAFAQGILILDILGSSFSTALEVGAGSCRNSVLLAQRGFGVVAMDYSRVSLSQALNWAKRVQNGRQNLDFMLADAFHLPFRDGSFNLIFHDGFICYFVNKDVRRLLNEQSRVSSKFIVATFYCAENRRNVRNVTRRALSDEKFYDFRFFRKSEVLALVRPYGDVLRLFPMGVHFKDWFTEKRMPQTMRRILDSFPIWRWNALWIRYFVIVGMRRACHP